MANVIDDRDRKILEAARVCVLDSGFGRLTRDRVAAVAGVSMGTVNTAFGNMDGLRTALMLDAIDRADIELLGRGLADKHPAALNAPSDLRERAALALIG